MSKRKIEKPAFKLEKQFKGNYRGYRLYVVVDAAKQEHWMAHSDWVTEGFITVTGSSEQETKIAINRVHNRIQQIRMYHKTHGKCY